MKTRVSREFQSPLAVRQQVANCRGESRRQRVLKCVLVQEEQNEDGRIPMRLCSKATLILFLATTLSASAQDDEDFPPGLLATYSSGGTSLQRVDSDLAFDWGSQTPDVRLKNGPFEAKWKGLLLLRNPSTYRFHVYLQGKVTVRVDGQSVLETHRASAGWVTGRDIPLDIGDRKIEVEFERTADKSRLMLCWSCTEFPIEPVPSYLLFREQPDDRLVSVPRGLELTTAARCNRCHSDPGALAPPAADLSYVRAGYTQEDLVERIANPHSKNASSQMPRFDWDDGEAEAVAAFLWKQSRERKLDQPSKIDEPRDSRAGEILFRSIGCAACHTVGEVGQASEWGGPDLSTIGETRTLDWLYTWLRKADNLRPHQRMPQFELKSEEQKQLAVYLSKLTGSSPSAQAEDGSDKVERAVVENGRKLVEEARCAACHTIPGADTPQRLPASIQWRAETGSGCASKGAERRRLQPRYAINDNDALRAYLSQPNEPVGEAGSYEHGSRLLHRKGCTSCHDRGADQGLRGLAGKLAMLDGDLKGQSEALLPPALDSIGDKLTDKALKSAIADGNTPRRLPWLRVRMPRFKHSPDESAAIWDYLVGHDRMPSGAPDAIELKSVSREDSQLSGYTLVSPRGLSCIACHAMGDYEPRNVALGTRGSNLAGISSRMRPEFFLRWTRSPIRITPGMEMPSYTKAVPSVLDGHVETQLSAIWSAVNDPDFVVPTNPAVVEQFVVVGPDDAPRVVRDVFTVDDANGGGYLARAFAVGFQNGHSLLFDIDSGAIRGWSFGDMARQRTSGKSWYWDLAGIPVATGFSTKAEWELHRGGETYRPVADQAQRLRLAGYQNRMSPTFGPSILIDYEVRFEIDGDEQMLKVQEEWSVAPAADGETAIRRGIKCDPPSDTRAFLSIPDVKSAIGNAQIHATNGSDKAGPGKMVEVGGSAVGEIVYTAELTRTHTGFKPRPEVEPFVEKVTTTPGYVGERLKIPASIMPTAITWDSAGNLVFTSLKGHVFRALDTDGDTIEDKLQVIEEGLAAPFGIIADGDALIVAQKPDLLRLSEFGSSGQSRRRQVVASGWGYSDNYHDWTCGIVRDSQGYLYVGLGSDYAQKERPQDRSRWRGAVLKIDPGVSVKPVGQSFRYPVGLGIRGDDVFVTDNQGVQNTFNEINHLREGHYYGVPSRYESEPDAPETRASVQIPHPWTRSVNALAFFDEEGKDHPFAGQGIGCEYDTRFLIRYSLQRVGDTYQGACYEFSDPKAGAVPQNFVGPICCAISTNGDIYIGSIHDSGWLGGQNTGEIVRLRRTGELPNGIRELTATPEGFGVEFLHPISSNQGMRVENFTVTGYTRKWGGSYGTPDSDRHRLEVKAAKVSADGRTVQLVVPGLKAGYVYEVICDNKLAREGTLSPGTGHYTMNVLISGQAETK